jgi:hypothetical protein
MIFAIRQKSLTAVNRQEFGAQAAAIFLKASHVGQGGFSTSWLLPSGSMLPKVARSGRS